MFIVYTSKTFIGLEISPYFSARHGVLYISVEIRHSQVLDYLDILCLNALDYEETAMHFLWESFKILA